MTKIYEVMLDYNCVFSTTRKEWAEQIANLYKEKGFQRVIVFDYASIIDKKEELDYVLKYRFGIEGGEK